MRPLLLSALLLLPLSAQDAKAPDPKPAATAMTPAEAMKKLAFLQGEWKGTGSFAFGPDRKVTFDQRETVESKLNGALIVVEGLGTAGGRPVHQAYGIFSYDPARKSYAFRAYLADGRFRDMDVLEVGDGGFSWGLTEPGGAQVRYTMTRGAGGEWIEKGARSLDGKAWTPFFEMSLAKVK
jgi:hypothetical protein